MVYLPLTVVQPSHALLKLIVEVLIERVGGAASHLPDSAVKCELIALQPLTMSKDQSILHSPQSHGQLGIDLGPLVIDSSSSVHGEWLVVVGRTTRIRRRRAGGADDTTDAIRAVACIRFVRLRLAVWRLVHDEG